MVAWLGRNEALTIVAAQQATRKVQGELRRMGLLMHGPDGLFGSKAEAIARFQRLNGLAPTGQPDEMTFLLHGHQDAPTAGCWTAPGLLQPSRGPAAERLTALSNKSPPLAPHWSMRTGFVGGHRLCAAKTKNREAAPGNLLVELGFSSAEDVARQLAVQRGLRFVDADEMRESTRQWQGFSIDLFALPMDSCQCGKTVTDSLRLCWATPARQVTELVQRKLGEECRFLSRRN